MYSLCLVMKRLLVKSPSFSAPLQLQDPDKIPVLTHINQLHHLIWLWLHLIPYTCQTSLIATASWNESAKMYQHVMMFFLASVFKKTTAFFILILPPLNLLKFRLLKSHQYVCHVWHEKSRLSLMSCFQPHSSCLLWLEKINDQVNFGQCKKKRCLWERIWAVREACHPPDRQASVWLVAQQLHLQCLVKKYIYTPQTD